MEIDDCSYLSDDCSYYSDDCSYSSDDCSYLTDDCSYLTDECNSFIYIFLNLKPIFKYYSLQYKKD